MYKISLIRRIKKLIKKDTKYDFNNIYFFFENLYYTYTDLKVFFSILNRNNLNYMYSWRLSLVEFNIFDLLNLNVFFVIYFKINNIMNYVYFLTFLDLSNKFNYVNKLNKKFNTLINDVFLNFRLKFLFVSYKKIIITNSYILNVYKYLIDKINLYDIITKIFFFFFILYKSRILKIVLI